MCFAFCLMSVRSTCFICSQVAKINGTVAGNTYRPDTVDWASVIQAIRVICTYEMRICNWCALQQFPIVSPGSPVLPACHSQVIHAAMRAKSIA